MDTQREKDIDLGNRYQFSKMTEGQCFINYQMADSLKVEQNDLFFIKMDMYQNLIALIDLYNSEVAIPKKLPTIQRNSIVKN
jgi:hypothetical protein